MVGIVISCRDDSGLESRPVELLPCRSYMVVFHSTTIRIIEGWVKALLPVCDTWERCCESLPGSASIAPRILTPAIHVERLSASRSECFVPRAHWIRGLVGLRASMHAVEKAKCLPFPGIEPGPNVWSTTPSIFCRSCETSPAPAHLVILTFPLYKNNAEEKVKR